MKIFIPQINEYQNKLLSLDIKPKYILTKDAFFKRFFGRVIEIRIKRWPDKDISKEFLDSEYTKFFNSKQKENQLIKTNFFEYLIEEKTRGLPERVRIKFDSLFDVYPINNLTQYLCNNIEQDYSPWIKVKIVNQSNIMCIVEVTDENV